MLKEKIKSDLTQAMKASKKDVVEVLRSVVTAITVKEKESGIAELSDFDVNAVIAKQVKDRKNSIQLFKEGNRPDLAEKEQAQIDILSVYLPKGLSESEVEAIIKEIIASNNYGKGDMGKVMGAWNRKYAGQADGKLVSDLVKANL
jgi:uncharacterized protein